jgi:hypothetical protein
VYFQFIFLIFKSTKRLHMKKILGLLIILSASIVAHAAILPPSKVNNEHAIGKTELESIKKFSTMMFNEYETMLGHKASRLEKFAFERMQKKSVKMLDENGNLRSKYERKFNSMYEGSGGSFLGGFALGFFLGAIGLLLAYVAFKDGGQKNRIKGAWWGFGVATILFVILIAAWVAIASEPVI